MSGEIWFFLIFNNAFFLFSSSELDNIIMYLRVSESLSVSILTNLFSS